MLLWRFKASKGRSGDSRSYTAQYQGLLKHLQLIKRDDNQYSSTLSEMHSQKLTAIPKGLYQNIDKQGKNTKKYSALKE